MPGYLLDTNVIRHWFDSESGSFPEVKTSADARAADSPLYVSAITLGEMEYGHARNPSGAGAKRDEFIRFVRRRLPQILEVSRHTAEPFGRIRAKLETRYPPKGGWPKKTKRRPEKLYDPVAARELGIDENDLWIVAQAVERNLILVTSDKMRRIREAVCDVYPSFRSEDWAEPGDFAGQDA